MPTTPRSPMRATRKAPASSPCWSRPPPTIPRRSPTAWKVLGQWQKPFLTAFSDSDPVTRGADRYFQKVIPGTQGQDHVTIENGGHFLQEDQGEALAEVVVGFLTHVNS